MKLALVTTLADSASYASGALELTFSKAAGRWQCYISGSSQKGLPNGLIAVEQLTAALWQLGGSAYRVRAVAGGGIIHLEKQTEKNGGQDAI